MSDANMKTFFEHCHDGSIGTRLDNFNYSHDLRWDKYDPDEEYFDMYCTYTNVADNDNYARPYLQLNYTVFDDENGDTSFTSLSFNGLFDAFQTSSTDIGSDEWNAERNAAYQELCETGSRTLSMLLKKDVTLDIEKFEKDGEKMSIEFLVNSDVSGEDYEYTVTINLNYTSDPSENVYFWCGDLFVA